MIPRAASVVTRRRALSSISGSASAVAAAAPRMVKQQRHGQQQQQRGLFFVQLTALAQPPAPMLHPSFDVPRPSFLRPRVQPPTPTPLPRSSTAAPTTPLAVPSPLSLPTGAHRGINTQARARTQQPTGPHGSSTAQSAVRLRGRLRRQQLQQRRGFWSPRFMKQIGVPWVVQIFYGTLLMIGIGVLAVSLFATSFVFGFLFLLAFAGFRLFSQRPQLARQVLRRPAQSPAGAFFRPLMDMLNEGVLIDGLKNARGTIERDVLACMARHPRLRALGTEWRATGLTNMSMETVSINGVKQERVVMEMLVVSSKPREVFVRVAASHHEGPLEGEGDDDRWEYESVQARTPDGIVVDLTRDVTRGGKAKGIVVDVPPRNVRDGDGQG